MTPAQTELSREKTHAPARGPSRSGIAAEAPRGQVAPAAGEFVGQIMDFCGSLFLLGLLSPVFAVVAALVKLDSRGPVFFMQRRCGKDWNEFRMFKFRTMVLEAESLKSELRNEIDGPMFKVSRDPRVTRIGRHLRRLSLDELPQLINVLRGEMSLVGPRPLAREEMTSDSDWVEARLSVKPGITGLWQVKGRGTLKFSDWVTYDMEYVRRRSPLGDLKILLLTIPAVIRRRGAG